jgi:hypothetical protein
MNDFRTRRLLLQGALTGTAASFATNAVARETAAPGRGTGANHQVLFLWLAGGASQFEMWDPKPGRATGGPFRAISTSVPGVQVGELMPRLAKRMHKLTVVRSLSTGISEHFQAADLISTGRPKESALDYPELGVTLAKELSRGAQQLPDYISIFRTSEGRRRAEPGFLGAAQLPIHLEKSIRPENIDRPKELSPERFAARAELRRELSRTFLASRADRAIAEPFESAHARTAGLMESTAPFDLEREPEAVRERYGRTPFGRHCLLARRLLEAGVPVVKVARGFWDSHHDNFESHRELVPDFDRVFSTLLDDLDERGMLERTLVMVLSEFGRTPKINKDVGRDHYATAWSCAFAGARTKPGAVFGKTDKDGAQVVDGKLNAGDLAATILAAVGVDHQKHFQVGLRPVPLAPEESMPAKEILI